VEGEPHISPSSSIAIYRKAYTPSDAPSKEEVADRSCTNLTLEADPKPGRFEKKLVGEGG
jgi:hypothetical protein